MTSNLFNQITSKLIEAKVSSPRLEARMLLEYATKENLDIWSLVEKRLSSMPVDKIIGKREFYKYSFYVNENVLSPRPDTEILVEKAVKIVQEKHFKNILDLGTGSGCIILSILMDCEELQGTAVDKSTLALFVAKKNAEALKLGSRVEFVEKDWFLDEISGKFDLIVSNPPYIPSADIKTLEKDVKEYDPMLALDGGADGLDSYKKIAALSSELLNDNGFILLEAGINQARDVADIFVAKGFFLVEVVKDFSGIERCIVLKK